MANQSTDTREALYAEYEDSLFRLIMEDAAEKEGKNFLEERAALQKDPSNQSSAEALEKLKRKVTAFRKKDNAQKKAPAFHRLLHKAAIFFLVLIAAFSTAITSVQAFRVKVLNFLIDMQPEYTSFQIKDSASGSGGEKLTVNWENAYLPTYVPEGYEIDSLTNTEALKEITYSDPKNENSYFYYTEYDSSNNLQVDTENASVLKTVSVGAHKGTLVVKNSLTTVVWEMDQHIFTVQTTENETVAMKIAENVKFKK